MISFADPYKACVVCGSVVTGVNPRNIPCGHVGYDDTCPSWGPVDGCSCNDHLGYVPHGEPTAEGAFV